MQEIRKNNKNQLNDYARYSAIAFKMLAVIVLGTLAGFKIDQWFNSKPVFIIVFALGSVTLAIYASIRDFLKEK